MKNKIQVLVETNPHKVGSKDRAKFDKIKSGMTVSEAFEVGVDQGYLRYGVKRGLFSIEGMTLEPVAKAKPQRQSEAVLIPHTSKLRSGEEYAYIYGDPRKIARVIKQGPKETEIKFHNGNVVMVSNKDLTLLPKAGDQVYLYDDPTDPEHIATVVKTGELQSELKRADGKLQVYPNSWFKPLKSKPGK